MKHRFQSEQGFGLITALLISFIVFILAALWYGISGHEIGEVANDKAAIAAINASEAGAREMMYILANDKTVRDALATSGAVYTTSPEGSACVFSTVDTSGTSGDPVGEYWVRATKTPGFTMRYRIEAWAWAPSHTARQHSEKKIDFEIELRPFGGGFNFAVFTGLDGYAGGNNKKVWGDVYSAQDFDVANSSTVLPNDIPWPGTGAVSVVGDMAINNNANSQFAGDVKVNGDIDDQKVNTLYQSDVYIGGSSSYLKKPTILGSLSMTDGTAPGGNMANVNQLLLGATWTPVEPLLLPDFDWSKAPNKQADINAGSWPPPNFDLGIDGQVTSYKFKPGDVDIDFSKVKAVHGDVIIYIPDGDATLTKWQNVTTDASNTPVTVAVVVDKSTKTLNLAQSFKMDDTAGIHFLGYSAGTVATENNTVVYGTLYGEGGNQGNRSYIHFRPIADAVGSSFTFDPAAADQFVPQPRVWREIPADTPGCTP